MRLWHIDLIPYLPNSQLIAQWRELNSIFKKQDKHILINYIYDYDKQQLLAYSNKVIHEMTKRHFKIKSLDNFKSYFNTAHYSDYFGEYVMFNYSGFERFKEHDNDYLHICFHNLKEKYIRGQKDFTRKIFEKLYNFYLTNARFNVIIDPRRIR